ASRRTSSATRPLSTCLCWSSGGSFCMPSSSFLTNTLWFIRRSTWELQCALLRREPPRAGSLRSPDCNRQWRLEEDLLEPARGQRSLCYRVRGDELSHRARQLL